ncbi:uncharacterized protein LOC115203021 isoform X2 [Salmo trutta]|uniref:uncharacterized protein LOC115203021 isoform X2 n=1 Tax=Salmo trutta TaxID=8032 RepID=UPI0011314747|nr:uncharacterized protein LOC115203021 isoform X2 [Salmo trutta]
MAALGLLWLVISSILVKCEDATSEHKKIYPAKIFGPSSVTEGVNVTFKCSTTGIKEPEDKFNFYLCKNGVGIRIMLLEKLVDDAIFTMKDVTREDSGNYSCVYTRDKPVPSQVISTGENLVFFQVDGEQKEGLNNVGGQGRAGLAAALVLLFLTLSVLLLLWRYWGILKQMIHIDHQPSENQDADQTYSLFSAVPVAAGVIEVPFDGDEGPYSMIGDWRGLKSSGRLRKNPEPLGSQGVSGMGSVVHHSPTDPTGDEALYSVITREQQGETAIYAKVTKTKKEKEKQDPVYSLPMNRNREDTMILYTVPLQIQ